ncbi:SURF1 family cytochrome oxidase biogenesis protein [Corynebacterium auris]|uniref:SURF1 family cytochrome oxidase biogenesis protein n=1 Tax=Corynebacterium auris TaxID=44750 RepID=UPI0025B4CF66|nr:SURF1 family cytochrome oxidase biogenesis protein [Corynebacterium auris]WJY68484.1 SURF1 family protein [Corynebacterium auris]
MATTNEKPWWKTFLTPGWVIAALLIAAFSYFAFTFLAPWQLGKNEALVERNEHIEHAFDNDPIPFDASAEEWTRVYLTGRYLPEDEVLLRLRPVDRTPAFQVLTPFALDSGETVLVNRGWVPASDGGTEVPEFSSAPTGRLTATGFVRADEGVHPTPPMHDQGYDMVYSISTGQVSELTGQPLASPYVQLAAGEPGELQAIPLPQLDTGNHLSYGLQWIAFGILAPAGLIYFIWAETRERRRFREEQEALLADAPLADTPSEPAPSEPAPARPRYGSAKRNPWAASYDRQEER